MSVGFLETSVCCSPHFVIFEFRSRAFLRIVHIGQNSFSRLLYHHKKSIKRSSNLCVKGISSRTYFHNYYVITAGRLFDNRILIFYFTQPIRILYDTSLSLIMMTGNSVSSIITVIKSFPFRIVLIFYGRVIVKLTVRTRQTHTRIHTSEIIRFP